MQEPTLFIGVDVSKAELVIAMGAERRALSIANDAASINCWLREIPAHALIAMESTGRYHGLLALLASQAGLKVYVLNVRDVFFYARALGTRAKTDGVDAGVIARYLTEHHARRHPWQPGNFCSSGCRSCFSAGRRWHSTARPCFRSSRRSRPRASRRPVCTRRSTLCCGPSTSRWQA